ncbi:MAG: ATP-dependent zinc metalloprotease FtsH [Clostridia bacterium]|nr:ATP-dependent zinc metalloprotease FtsH [Clostridia bacterium]
MKKHIKSIVLYLLLIGAVIFAVATIYNHTEKEKIILGDVVSYFEADRVTSFVIDGKYYITMNVIKQDAAGNLQTKEDGSFDTSEVAYQLRSVDLFNEYCGDYVKNNQNLKSYDIEPQAVTPWWVSMLPWLLIIVAAFLLYFFMMRSMAGPGSKINSFGKARAKTVNDSKDRITFEDVAGSNEEKQELEEIVEFLKDPAKFTRLGAKIPHGVLLVGPPGTGKTLLAKAVAGEAGVPFYSLSGSDFVEMYVGVGASRVRDLFETARKSPASIIFIDEIDAVGRHRGAGLGGGHDEREQTLNQLLVEMDGFGSHEGIIVIAATNRPDILDPALLRPGRFDRQITVDAPDVKEREAILQVHVRKKPLEATVDLAVVAKKTAGFTGADLANLLNEAALLAARRNKSLIGTDDIDDAFIRVIAGPKKASRVMSERERKNTAYHEAGHAIVAHVLPHLDAVHQISIIPSGRALGYTMSLPAEDKYSVYKQELKEQIAELLAGRVAEALIFGDISGGASNDIERATSIARKMVTQLGMSDVLGPVKYGTNESEVFLGRDFAGGNNFSEEVSAKIDAEIKALIDEGYATAERVLSENRAKLDFVAAFLLKNELMDSDQFTAAMDRENVTIEELEAMAAEKREQSRRENEARAQRLREEAEAAAREAAAAEAALMGSFTEHPQATDSVQDATLDTQSNGNDPDGNDSNDNDNSDVTGKDTRA